MRRTVLVVTGGIFLVSLICWWTGDGHHSSAISATEMQRPARDEAVPLVIETPAADSAGPSVGRPVHDPVIISPCHVVAIQEQEVASAVDGTIKEVLADLGRRVRQDELLGRLDDRQLRAHVELLEIKAGSKAAELIAKAQHDDVDSKITMAGKLRQRQAISELEYKTYFFQRQRFAHEMEKARDEQASTKKELEKSLVLLQLHEIRSGLDGEVVKVYKHDGEAVKQSEPLFRVANFDRLRIEGLCKLQQADLLHIGMPALVEPERRGEQLTELAGHTGTITGLAMATDGSLLASAAEDRTVLLWNWPAGTRRGRLVHPAEVYAVSLAAGKKGNQSGYWLLTGCADGQARLWFMSRDGKHTESISLQSGHEAAVRAVAFNSDGSRFATGSDDRRIGIWETATGRHVCWLQEADDLPAHNGAVTSLEFTRGGYLVSAGRDNTLKVWKLSDRGGELKGAQPGRTGEVTRLGVSPGGQHLIFDHGEELRLLDRHSLATVGLLRSPRQERFRVLAQFSPSSKLLLAGCGTGRLQLWKLPAAPELAALCREARTRGIHVGTFGSLLAGPGGFLAACATLNPGMPGLSNPDAYEIRQFQSPGPAMVQAATFAPDESVLFTGGSDKVVHVWSIPGPGQWRRRLEARVTYVASHVEPGTDMIRVRAELDNPTDPARRLRPGTHATLRLYP